MLFVRENYLVHLKNQLFIISQIIISLVITMKTILIILLLVPIISYSQTQNISPKRYLLKSPFNKDYTLSKAKTFITNSLINDSITIAEVVLDPYISLKPDDISSICYSLKGKGWDDVGLLLGFYGEFWDDFEGSFKGYGFKLLKRNQATNFLKKIIDVKTSYENYLNKITYSNNVVFFYDDLKTIMFKEGNIFKVQIIWNGVSAIWSMEEVERTYEGYKRLLKKSEITRFLKNTKS